MPGYLSLAQPSREPPTDHKVICYQSQTRLRLCTSLALRTLASSRLLTRALQQPYRSMYNAFRTIRLSNAEQFTRCTCCMEPSGRRVEDTRVCTRGLSQGVSCNTSQRPLHGNRPPFGQFTAMCWSAVCLLGVCAGGAHARRLRCR